MSIRIAVYTNVLLSGLIWPRWQHEVLQHALAGDIQLVLPEIVILEARRHILRNFPEFGERFESFLACRPYFFETSWAGRAKYSKPFAIELGLNWGLSPPGNHRDHGWQHCLRVRRVR
jgi:hypothetical protein